MTYSEKLKDPRWQRRRLEVLQRAGFACEFCGNEKETLHVHHLKYVGEPWEAPDNALECLCETHHAMIEREGLGVPLLFTKSRARTVRAFYALMLRCSGSGVALEVVNRALEVLADQAEDEKSRESEAGF